MTRSRWSVGRAVGVGLLVLIGATALPARATILLSFSTTGYGIGFGGAGDPVSVSPAFSFGVNGVYLQSQSLVIGDNGTVVIDLAGPAFAAAAAELTDGSATDSYQFRTEIDSVNHQFSLTLILGEFVLSPSDLSGSPIGGIRIILSDLCVEPSTQGDLCAFPTSGFVGFGTSSLTFLVSDTPFGVPEPSSIALLAIAVAAASAARRRIAAKGR